ncbi:uncharacterized protein LOC111704961 [Eurytemora carolleeae]|uniref:uncharacterized protein LOC111704961 n=1 Tax=Eurytemora carolleeae TaxID=1294199 RepID=UPI000C777287|nr:uncharacterized protein LOC111704961 [Eurytemora carolleeae]|eukprot:XP_023333132.1 uncharacterized protein LOC111704961 [Eurytemora affinis]
MQNPGEKHVLYPQAPAGYGDPSQVNLTNPGENRPTNVGKATSKAGAYGGSELGSIVGGAVGPPVIGSIIGNLVGERVGEKAINETGLNKFATKTGDKLSGVIGRNNVEKMSEITLSALGYSETEECVCCPCLPASQVLLVLAIPFFFFNFYKLGLGVSYDSDCSKIAPDKNYTFNSTDDIPDIYPCEFGFHYLVVSGAVWIALLPFWICGLFGNCWRQCCCCCCDPVVICSTVVDLLQRCCCECGNFKLCEVLWMIHCLFHMVWSVLALAWLIGLQLDLPVLELKDQIEVPGWNVPKPVSNTVIASIVLDFVLAGSELFHRIRVKLRAGQTVEHLEMEEQRQELHKPY